MRNESFTIDAVELSRRLRIETAEELDAMSPEERIRFLNEFAKNDPVLSKMKRHVVPGQRAPQKPESK